MIRRRPSQFPKLAFIATVLSTHAIAQPTRPDSTAQMLEEIIVTATKTGETTLQNTPLTIMNVTSEDLRQGNIKNIKDLSILAPNVNVSQNSMSGQLYIRGVGTNNIFIGGDPSTTVHLDGVVLARPVSLFNELLELERVEILKGPQGTLYGRNATGGTINLITKKPTDHLKARVSGEIGRFSRKRASLFLNTPLVENTLSGNVSLVSSKRDGIIDNKNPLGNFTLQDEDISSARIALRYQPSDTLDINVSMDRFVREETPPQYKPTLQTVTGSQLATTYPQIDIIDDIRSLNIPLKSHLDENHQGLSTALVWSKALFELTSITGYRQFDFDTIIDTDFTEIASRSTYLEEDQHQLSQELRITFRKGDFSVLGGFYYLHENASSAGIIGLEDRQPSQTAFINGKVVTDANAVFIDTQWHFNANGAVSVGGRYSREEKEFDSLLRLDTGESVLTTYDDSLEEDWTNFSPKIGLNYTFSDTSMLYGSISKGFKSGGFNFSTGDNVFKPEKITAYEIGYKADLFQERLRLNTAVFIYDYTDLQVQQFIITITGAPRPSIENASDAKIKGIELELVSWLTSQWRVKAYFAYLDAKYKDFITQRFIPNPEPPPELITLDVDVEGNYLNSAPKYSTSIATDYHLLLPNTGELFLHLAYYWQDEMFYTAFNDPIPQQDAYGLLNASISYHTPNKRYEIQAFGKNLTDKEYTNASQDFSPLGVTLAINEPRTYGIKISYWYD